jgi:hypothetical protein
MPRAPVTIVNRARQGHETEPGEDSRAPSDRSSRVARSRERLVDREAPSSSPRAARVPAVDGVVLDLEESRRRRDRARAQDADRPAAARAAGSDVDGEVDGEEVEVRPADEEMPVRYQFARGDDGGAADRALIGKLYAQRLREHSTPS